MAYTREEEKEDTDLPMMLFTFCEPNQVKIFVLCSETWYYLLWFIQFKFNPRRSDQDPSMEYCWPTKR